MANKSVARKVTDIVFDLDGTLVDSAKSILSVLSEVVAEAGYKAKVPIERSLIGPPLIDVLRIISGEHSHESLARLVGKFKSFYDDEGYKSTVAYPGIDALLGALATRGFCLHLATNKRLVPTVSILNLFGWSRYFSEVFAIDKCAGRPYIGKSEMLGALLRQRNLDPAETLYVGDRTEDFVAATENGMQCIMVRWGYGDYGNMQSEINAVNSPGEILDFLVNA